MNRDIVAALLVLFVGLTAGPSLDTIKRAPWAELRGEFTIASKLVQEATRRGVIPKGHWGVFQEASARGLLKTEPSVLDEGGIYLQAGNEVAYISPAGGGAALSDRVTRKRMRQLGTNALEVNATKGTTRAWLDGSFKKVASTAYPDTPAHTTMSSPRLGS